MVESLCATIIVVLFLEAVSIASLIFNSVIESSEEVASSKKMIGALF